MAVALRENRPVRGESAIAERPDGTRIHFQPYPTPLRDEGGRLIGGVNVLVDVTDRQLAKAKLEATSEALAISSSARDDFLGLVSHELRTPVTTIYGNARLLLDRLERFPPEEAGMVADMAADSGRLLDIVENLLLLSRLQAGAQPELEPTLLKHIVRQEIRSFARRHPDRVVDASIGGHHVVIDADRAYLMLVLQNLLSNAHKYGGDGRIEISVEDVPGEVRVSVLDRGIGIQGLAADDLFAPFYRAKDAQRLASGLGLGLPVCRRIVEVMGGRIWALPREGGGSEFGFALPVSPDPLE
jgi:signal transduction histidine kinase